MRDIFTLELFIFKGLSQPRDSLFLGIEEPIKQRFPKHIIIRFFYCPIINGSVIAPVSAIASPLKGHFSNR